MQMWFHGWRKELYQGSRDYLKRENNIFFFFYLKKKISRETSLENGGNDGNDNFDWMFLRTWARVYIQMCIQANWIRNQIFRSYSHIHVAFFFFLRNISLAVAFQISCVFFLPPFSRKNPSLFVSSKEKKRKERRNEQKRWRFLDIYVFLFFFTPFLINVSIFYTAALKEKFFFFWERSVTREFIIIITLV